MSQKGIKKWLAYFNKYETLIISHGAWLKPTFIGFYSKKAGFRWLYLSHGMFEPWAMRRAGLRKKYILNF